MPAPSRADPEWSRLRFFSGDMRSACGVISVCNRRPVRSHAPTDYTCPFCRNIEEGIADHPLEVIYRDDDVFVKMNPKWRPNNPGNVMVLPIKHYESIFDLLARLATPIQRAAQAAAIAMKSAFGCDGISTRQHNEPAGNQDVWHYHVHVFPRWHGDNLYALPGVLAPAAELHVRAEQLRRAWPANVR